MISRTLEAEVMEDAERAAAYAAADFSAVNQAFADRFLAEFPDCHKGRLLDLGCGPGDIPIRLARAAPGLKVTAVDASSVMLGLARNAVSRAGLKGRLRLLKARIPGLPGGDFDAVVSNSLLHQLHRPAPFWREVQRMARPGAAIFVMDLFRPDSAERARRIVESSAAGEHPLLKEDFYNSLLAAFTPEEVDAQLASAGFKNLKARIISERHWLVSGRL